MRVILITAVFLMSCFGVARQDAASSEKRVALNEKAVALDGTGATALEATLKTTALSGSDDSPVTNIGVVIRNSSNQTYVYVSGLLTFYDASGVRCGEGVFKADALSADESFETDAPGIRIRCAPSTWRIVATSLVLKVAPLEPSSPSARLNRSRMNLVISVDGEEHPIQLDKPMVVKLGDVQRTNRIARSCSGSKLDSSLTTQLLSFSIKARND